MELVTESQLGEVQIKPPSYHSIPEDTLGVQRCKQVLGIFSLIKDIFFIICCQYCKYFQVIHSMIRLIWINFWAKLQVCFASVSYYMQHTWNDWCPLIKSMYPSFLLVSFQCILVKKLTALFFWQKLDFSEQIQLLKKPCGILGADSPSTSLFALKTEGD